jgi:hypothetical protein
MTTSAASPGNTSASESKTPRNDGDVKAGNFGDIVPMVKGVGNVTLAARDHSARDHSSGSTPATSQRKDIKDISREESSQNVDSGKSVAGEKENDRTRRRDTFGNVVKASTGPGK